MKLGLHTMLHYTVRTALFNAVGEVADKFHGRVLDVGCGSMPYRDIILEKGKVEDYIGLDIETEANIGIPPHILWDGMTIPLPDSDINCILTTEFLEHHSMPASVLKEMNRVMRTDGFFFATVPFIWNLHELPYDEFRYTPISLERLMREAGFRDIRIEALGGWNYSLAQMIGLWITFAPLGRYQRAIFRRVLYPFYSWLIRTDIKPQTFDGGENSMFSALSISARK